MAGVSPVQAKDPPPDPPSKPCRLVAIDLDGTTVADNESWGEEGGVAGGTTATAAATAAAAEKLPAGTVEAAVAYQEAGGHLVIATGRGYYGARAIAAQLFCDRHVGLMVCGNGATVHDLKSSDPSKSILRRQTLRAETLSSLYRLILRANPGQQLGVKLAEANTYMYNAPKEMGLLRFLRDAVDDA